ncbi:DNA ligase D [Undibacterium sp. TJN25]|uniref:DNA ligase D n=1 Tax=Undibacterium sp. TJN25 TaxID=3413056 RepID=UPI003BF33671
MAKPDALTKYKSKRNFSITSEPAEGGTRNDEALGFVIQKHWASRLHYDFRLELQGTMKSWAVPKGPSFDPRDKRMAVHVEDHPISYNTFEGTIPAKQYGAGKVIIWDKGIWRPIGDAGKAYAAGSMKFELFGHKLRGKWALVKMRNTRDKQDAWLLIKEKDAYARPAEEFSVVDEQPDSVKSLGLPEIPMAPEDHAADDDNGHDDGNDGQASGTTINTSKPPAAAKKAALPASLKPELATLVDNAPADASGWTFEVKFDGYRILSRVDHGKIKLFTRNGNDWTAKMPRLHKELLEMDLPNGWYDGEIVVLNENGKPDFGALQLAFDDNATAEISYFLFDLPYCSDHDLREVPLQERRQVLERILQRSPSELVRFSGTFDHPAAEIVSAACQMGLEGVIGKRADSRYVSRRSDDWIKLKCSQRQEFVIGGFTDPQGSRIGIGSLLLGVYDEDGILQYAGNVGTGFNQKILNDLRVQLDAIRSDERPFPDTADVGRKSHWVKPQLVAEVTFGEWTSAGHIRHSVFQGLRADKAVNSVVREQPRHLEAVPKQPKKNGTAPKSRKAGSEKTKAEATHARETLPESFKVTHPERIIDKASGTTKLQLVRYYGLVAPLMMEHLADRPIALVRAPAGIGGELFFQKHADTGKMPGIKQLDRAIFPAHPSLLAVEKPEGLLYAAQWNTVEVHTMNALAGNFGKPDRMVFDLDPGEGVQWEDIQEAAALVRGLLDELGLHPFIKTSGGKGLHIVVPIQKRYDWTTVKDFSEAIVAHMAKAIPARFVLKSGPKNRVGKIFIDYLRNGLGATTVCAWSARARPGMGISVPIRWDELEKIKGGDHWTLHSVHKRLDTGNEPWSDYANSAQSLTAAMKTMGFKPAR